MSGWTALVLAGSRPGRDAFAEQYGTDLKALIPIAGEPMVRRPVAALLANDRISKVIVLAQQPERIAGALPSHPQLSVQMSSSTIAATLEAACKDPATAWPILVTTADHALLDTEMIDEFCRKAAQSDLAIAFVERRSLLRRLPQSKRTWIRFRQGAYSGANLFWLGSPKVASALAAWRAVEQDRKTAWRLLWALGPTLFLGAALRMLSLQQVTRRLGQKLGLKIEAIEMTNPLAAVDVDKTEDHRLVEAILEGRA